MNKVMIAGGVFFIIVAIVVAVFIYIQFKERLNSTNNTLPDIDELNKQERLKRMEANRDEYGYSASSDDLSIEKIGTTDDTEIDVSKYLDNTHETSINDDFKGLINSKGEVGVAVPTIIKAEIDLPDIVEATVEMNDEINHEYEISSVAMESDYDETIADDYLNDENEAPVVEAASKGSEDEAYVNVHEEDVDGETAELEGLDDKSFSLPTID